jgi:hypothetical protein
VRSRVGAVLVVSLLVLVALPGAARADHTPLPTQVTLVGSLQSELGCPGDWQPECLETGLLPVAGSPGVFRATFEVPAGDFEYKVALNGSWDENYGAGGAPGGANIPLTAPGGQITFTYDHATHRITDNLPRALGAERAAHWLRRGLLAWQPAPAATYRLYFAPDGGMTVEDGAIVGAAATYDLTPATVGVPADFPHLASYATFALPASARSRVAELLAGQVAVAAFDAAGGLVDATGV